MKIGRGSAMSEKMAWTAWVIRRIGTDQLATDWHGRGEMGIFENESDAIDHCEEIEEQEEESDEPKWEVVKVRITTDE
jgi:hypothetical protein